MKKFMKRTIFLSFALSCAAIAQQPSTSTPSPEQVENAIQRLPAAYRNAANTFLHLENENLAHIASESDQKWIDEAIATILRNPDGRSFLIDQLEKEPDGRLRASIL